MLFLNTLAPFETLNLGPCLSSWMGLVIGLHQPVDAHVCILLCRGKALMTQKFLNHSQIRPGIEHVGGKRMTQGMGRNRYQQAAFF